MQKDRVGFVIIEIEIPDWADQHDLLLFHGIELIAVKRQVGGEEIPWAVKDGRCSRCGSCCEVRHIKGLPLPVYKGVCIHLRKKNGKPHCSFEHARPFCCCLGEPKYEPNCTITWRHMEGNAVPDSQK